MSDADDPKKSTTPDDPEAADSADAAEPQAGESRPSPEEELKAAFGHLKSAAGAFFDRIKKDESLKKAAEDAETAVAKAATGAEKALGTVAAEAEKALKKLGEKAEPVAKNVAKEIGDELGRVAKSVTSVFEPDPIPGEPPKTESSETGAQPAEKADEDVKEEKGTKDE